jgi:predicted nucleic acid-binding protein
LVKHKEKLLKLTKLNFLELEELEKLVTSNLTFINESLIQDKDFVKSRELLEKIDLNDIPFVALTLNLEGTLWTGDKILIQGLRTKGFTRVINTVELSKILDQFEKEIS